MALHPAVADHLHRLAVPHRVLPCDPELADTAAFCAAYGVDPIDSANTIVVASKRPEGKAAACVVLATTRLDVNRTVRGLLGVKKVSFASEEQTMELTDMMIGGVTPFGLPKGLPVFVDSAVMDRPTIVLGAGSRSAKLEVEPEVLLELPDVAVVEGLAAPL